MLKRPVRVVCLAILVVFAVVWNGLRLGETFFFWKTLEKYGVHPLYIAVSGGFWIFIGLVLCWGFWQGKPWGWSAVLGGIIAYEIWFWFDRLVMQKPHANLPFLMITNLVFLLIIFTILLSNRTRLFFKKDVYE